MSNQIVKALEHAAEKIGKTLAKDAGKAVKDFYHSAGQNLKKVASNVREVEEKHAKDLAKILEGGKKDVPHPRAHSGGGRRGRHRGEHGAGRRQVHEPRHAARREDAKCPGGEPVDMATGRMFINQVDADLPGSLPLLFVRNFESGYQAGRWMGPRWTCTFDERLEIDDQGVVYLSPDLVSQAYPHPEPGDPVHASAGARTELALTDTGDYTLTDRSTGLVREFTLQPGGEEALLTKVRDRHGRHYTLAYDEDGTPLSITHSGGYQLLVTVDNDRITALRLADATEDGHDALLLRYGYSDDGHLTSVYNSSGKPMRFANDASGHILSWTDRNNSQYRYTYDQFDRVTDEGGADGTLRFHFTYGDPDPDTGLKTHTETNALGHTTTYTVNQHAQITAITDALGNTTHTERDEFDRLLTETDPLGRTTRYEYDGAGDLIRITRPDGEQATASYHDSLSLPTLITEPGGVTWQQTYDHRGLRTTLTDPLGATTRFSYDERGHRVSVTDALGNMTRISCDAAGLPSEITDPTGATTQYERDAFGRPIAVVDPLGNTTQLVWTTEGRLASRTTADGSTEAWTYDGEGNCLSHTDQLGRTSSFEYTHFETLAARTTPDGARITFTHDANMQLVAVTNALGQRWQYTYDAAGRLISERDFHGRVTNYQLDDAGRLSTTVNPAGEQIGYTYDALDRLVARDAAGRSTTFDYDLAGHLVRATNADADLVRTVDPLGNLLTESVNGRTIGFALDTLGRRVRRATPSGHTSTWSYDAVGRPTALATSGGSVDISYDPAGREQQRTIAERLTLTRTWDILHRLTSESLGTPHQRLVERTYGYQVDGTLASVDDRASGLRTFDLDPVGRVTAVRATDWTESYAYDSTGNLTDARWPASSSGEAAVGSRTYTGTQLTTAGRVRYEYDAAGRTTLRQVTRLSRKPDTWQYGWDAENRLTEVTTPDGNRWRYRYDPLGRRIAKERLAADGTTVEERTDFTWDGPTLVEQTAEASYLPGPHTISWDHDGLLPLTQTETISSQDRIDRRFFAIVTDLVGTPTELVDPSTDSIAWCAMPTLWGHTTWRSDSTTYTPLRFPGQYYDPETRLNYNLHRYYDSETARYTTPDPLGLAAAPNPDAYVHNPHTWTDPLGLSPHPEGTTPTPPKKPAKGYDLRGKDPLSIVPKDAEVRQLTPHSGGGAQYGVEYKWTNEDGHVVRMRIHGPDGLAPAGSNAASGDIFRIQIGKRYQDLAGNLHHPNSHNPKSPHYNPTAANDSHMPWPIPWAFPEGYGPTP